jgi:energy-coupling factor transport system ATP-binding protein
VIVGEEPRLKDELFGVWRDTRLIVLAAQIAAIYAAVLIPFKVGIPLIPGFVELRPANAVPIVASLLFGPAAAWGSAFGNLIGDLFGTLGPGSLFGFLGNFFYAYLPYRLWGRLGPLSSGRPPEPQSPGQVLEYLAVCVLASLACAATIGVGLDLLRLLPMHVLVPAIFVNNLFMSALLGLPLLRFLHPRVTRWGLLYEDIKRDRLSGRRTTLDAVRHDRPAMPADAREITIEDLRFTYRGESRPALHGLTFSLKSGTMTLLLGATGSGKSTLCYCLNGLIPHHLHGEMTGTVLVGGQDSRQWTVSQQARTVGLLFQDFESQLVSTNVEQELAFPLRNLRPDLRPEAAAARMTHTLAQVGLEGYRLRDPLTLSGGERQRLAIASVLAPGPPVLVLDDPSTDLDPAGRAALYALLRELRAKGATVVVSDRDADEAGPTDRACLLSEGGLAWDGSSSGLLRKPALMEQGGIQPLPLPAFFATLGYTDDLPLSPEEAVALLKGRTVRITPPASSTPTEEPAGQPVIEARAVGYVYASGPSARRQALDRIDLTIKQAEFIALIGRNGSGKTTLAKLFNGLLAPTRGVVLVHGQETRRMKAGQLAVAVGYVFQNPDHQIFAETVYEEVAFGPRNLGVSGEEIPGRVREALDAVGLDRPGIETTDPFSLTKGDRQRVAVASVLATRPGILIFDEPTTGLDYREVRGMMGLIRRLNQSGHTIVMITHCMWVVAEYAARCVVMQDGRIVADGPTRAIFAQTERLESLGLRLPPITRFSQHFGQTLLTMEELATCFRIE